MFIEFSEFNLKLLFFLIYPIFITIQDYTYASYIKHDKDNLLFTTFRYFLCYIFSGILLLIFKFRTKRTHFRRESSLELSIENVKNNHKITSMSQVEIEQKLILKKKIIRSTLFLFLLSAIGIFTIYAGYYFKKKEYSNAKHSVRTFFEITNFAVLSYFILQQKLYKHHFISYGLITIILIIIFIISYTYLKKILESIIFYFLYELVFALYDVLIKKYMNVFYKSPYFTMFWLGLISTIALLIYDAIAYFVNPDVSGIIIGLKDNIDNIGDFFLFVLDLIIEYAWNLGIWLLIYYYTPCHYFISEFISEYFYYLSNVIKENDEFYSTKNGILFSICFLLIIIFSLVFNEVIILNFWRLDYNTNKRIYERQKYEFDIDLKNKDSVLKDIEEEESNE